MLTAEQLRAARALRRWDQSVLAERSGVSVETIKRLEKMEGRLTTTRVATLDALRSTLESDGVVFLADGETVDGGPGVRLRRQESKMSDKQREANQKAFERGQEDWRNNVHANPYPPESPYFDLWEQGQRSEEELQQR